MSPILDIQRRLHQDGRIRLGQKVGGGKGRPTSLDQFRFTSQNRRAIESIAQTYGGKAEKWDDAPAGEQWQVFTEASDIPVVVPPESMSFSQHYEMWSGGGCKRRCDGVNDIISDGPCLCDPENRDCKPHTRLSVMLAQYPGTGLWRLDCSGYYGAVELGGSMEIVGMLSAHLGRSVLPGRLRIERRTVKRPDKPPNNFVVPVLDFEVDMAALAMGNVEALTAPTGEIPAPRPALTPVPFDETPALSLPDQLTAMDDTEPKEKRAGVTTIPATGVRPRTAEQAAAGNRPDQDDPKELVTAKAGLRAVVNDIQPPEERNKVNKLLTEKFGPAASRTLIQIAEAVDIAAGWSSGGDEDDETFDAELVEEEMF